MAEPPNRRGPGARPARWVAMGVVAVGVVALGIVLRARRGPGPGHPSGEHVAPTTAGAPSATPSPSAPPSPEATVGSPSATAAQADRLARAAAEHFLSTYLDPGGRVVRRDQGGDTVSEGQAYAMLAAVAIGDQHRFDLAWNWAKANLQRPDGLLSWHWAGGRILDTQAASDADLDAARALLLAAQRFGQAAYRQEGLRMGQSVLSAETVQAGAQQALVAGPWAQTPPWYVDPSYFSPRTFALLAATSGDPRWAALTSSSYRLLHQLSAAPGLPADWGILDAGGTAHPSAAPGGGGGPSYGYDATRSLVRQAEDCNPQGQAIAAAAWPFLRSAAAGGLAAVYSLSGQPLVTSSHPVADVAAAAAATAAGDRAAASGLLERAAADDAASPSYYGAAWVALGRIMLTTAWLGGCP